MKKTLFLVLYLIFFFLGFFFLDAAWGGVKKAVNPLSIVILVFIGLIFVALTVLVYKLYKREKMKK